MISAAVRMQQKTDGRVVRVLTKHVSAEDMSVPRIRRLSSGS
jgi:hypothetical protein